MNASVINRRTELGARQPGRDGALRRPRRVQRRKTLPDVGKHTEWGTRFARADAAARCPCRCEILGLTDAGFTLIELILAVAVMAIVLVAINAVFFSAMRLRESTTDAVDASLPVEQALSIIRRDLANVIPPRTNGIFDGNFKVGDISSTGLNQPVAIEFYTTTGALRSDEPWGDVQRVTYELKPSGDPSTPGRVLYRSVTRNILANITPQPRNQWLLGGVLSLQFSCYDGSQWRNYWDTSTTDTNLPVAVRVSIQLADSSGNSADSQPLEIVVPIDAQARPASQ